MLVQVGDSMQIDRKARMRLKSQGLLVRPADDRVHDFNETVQLGDEKWAQYEASRCIHCYNPPCRQACPAGNDISRALWLIEQGKFLEAAQVYRKTTTFPEICGRVCPQEKLCEGACVRNRRGDAVPTGALEAFVTEYERRTVGYTIPVPPPTGRKVAVVGGGPSGLACAEQLVRMGHWVTIFDNHAALGGALTYGFPNFKLPHTLLNDIIKSIRKAGVAFIGKTMVGKKKKTVNDLFAEGYESIFLGLGSGIDQSLEVPGENLPGVYFATDFLVRTNTEKKNLPARQRIPPDIGTRVVVVGGGDPATDCARTAIRLGARKVTCLYRYTEAEVPGRGHDREWAEEEGVQFRYLTKPVRITEGERGRVGGLDCVHYEIGEPDSEGVRHPHPVVGSEFHIQADAVIIAKGYYPDPIIGATTPGLKTHKWGLIVADSATGATSRFGVYTGGDIVTGPDMVVSAMLAGRKAAYTIDAYLS